MEIWIGAMAPKALDLIGRKADGWVPGGGVSRIADFPRLNARIDEAAMAAGRDPAAIRRIYNIGGTITDGTRGDGPLEGPPEQWVETLTGWAHAQRANAFVFWPADMETDQIERFATEVVPSVRKAFA